jgi:hypothetical protein
MNRLKPKNDLLFYFYFIYDDNLKEFNNEDFRWLVGI